MPDVTLSWARGGQERRQLLVQWLTNPPHLTVTWALKHSASWWVGCV